jgi:two-component system sensor histidine kinase QseC
LTVRFNILGQEFLALNGGNQFKFNPSVSFMVPCKTQKEIDTYWKKLLTGGGKEMQCGWLTDKYGVAWQIFPGFMSKIVADKNKERRGRVMQAMMQMVKMDIKTLQAAYAQKRK